MPVCWGFFFHFIKFFFLLLSSGHVESRSGDTMIGRDLWLWRAIRLSCLYSSLSKPFVKVRSFLCIICHPPPPPIPHLPSPDLALICTPFDSLQQSSNFFYCFWSVLIHYSAVLDRLLILNRKKYIKCNIWFGDLWNLTGLKYSKALFLTSWRISKSSSKTTLNTNFLCNHDEICPNPALSCRRDIKCALIGIFFSFWI